MFSLIISCPNCTGNVDTLMEAIGFSSMKPKEVIVITRREINLQAYENVAKTTVKVMKPAEEKALSAAAVRNLGASVATAPILMFLQKDYYPESDYFEEQINFVQKTEGILMGNYMDNMKPHHAETFFSSINDYGNFNGRNFTIKKADFEEIGGFDESYFGQGVEDIDFGYIAKQKKVPIYVHGRFIKDLKTEVYELPLNQFLPIIDNCDFFKKKWNIYPMKNCLKSFKEKGLINWNETDDGELGIIKFPSFEMIESAKVRVPISQSL